MADSCLNKYFRSVGFGALDSYKLLFELAALVIEQADEMQEYNIPNKEHFREYKKEFAQGMGVCVGTIRCSDENMIVERVYPYLRGEYVSSIETVNVDKNNERFCFSGLCDDERLDISLIFSMQDCVKYLAKQDSVPAGEELISNGLVLTALGFDGTILLPLVKDPEQIEQTMRDNELRSRLIEAAEDGDEEAREELAIQEMDAYEYISKRVATEDVFSVVDTSFMPHGIESDQYAILAEILECKLVENSFTHENVWKMRVDCNDIIFELCINEADLVGEPDVGRRFKGVICMQGRLCVDD